MLHRIGLGLPAKRAKRLRVARAEREHALHRAQGHSALERAHRLAEQPEPVRGLAVREPRRGRVLRKGIGLRALVEILSHLGVVPVVTDDRLEQPFVLRIVDNEVPIAEGLPVVLEPLIGERDHVPEHRVVHIEGARGVVVAADNAPVGDP